VFVEYFEAFRPWLDKNVSRDFYIWPSRWNFARVVRNAIVHNSGRVYWNDPKPSSLPISWYGLTYSNATNRRHIIGPDLNVGDLVILLLEMNEALDRAGCPH
jgi:hypothetical protein